MSDDQDQPEEQPCLHCPTVDVIDDFFAECSTANDEPNTIDGDEVTIAVAKAVAELTCGGDAVARQNIIEQFMREIMSDDAKLREQESAAGSDARH
jgi:hypothetical protein